MECPDSVELPDERPAFDDIARYEASLPTPADHGQPPAPLRCNLRYDRPGQPTPQYMPTAAAA